MHFSRENAELWDEIKRRPSGRYRGACYEDFVTATIFLFFKCVVLVLLLLLLLMLQEARHHHHIVAAADNSDRRRKWVRKRQSIEDGSIEDEDGSS